MCKIRICCLIGKLIFVIPWETGKRAGASKAKTGTSGLMMLDQMSRNKCNSSHYVHNWETGKIAPLEQWGAPTNTPGTALDNRGVWVWGGVILGGWPASAQQCSSLCHQLSSPLTAEAQQSSVPFNGYQCVYAQCTIVHGSRNMAFHGFFLARAGAWIGPFHTVLCKNGHEIRTTYLKQLRVNHILCYHEWESVFWNSLYMLKTL